MIDLKKAQAQQNSFEDGSKTDWIISLDGVELYRLPKAATVQETFAIRDSIEKLMSDSFDAGVSQAKQLAKVTLDRVVENGNAQLDALKQENLRLAGLLESFISEGAN